MKIIIRCCFALSVLMQLSACAHNYKGKDFGVVWNYEGQDVSAYDVGAFLLKDNFDNGIHYDIEIIKCERISDTGGQSESCIPHGVTRPRALLLAPGSYRFSFRTEYSKNGEDLYTLLDKTMDIDAGTAYEMSNYDSGTNKTIFRVREVPLAEATETVNTIFNQAELERVAEIEKISFVKNSTQTVELLIDEGDPMFTTFVGVVGCAAAVVSDIFEAPTKSVRLIDLHNQAAFHPAAWGRPDSMIAKAVRQRQNNLSAPVYPLVAATDQ